MNDAKRRIAKFRAAEEHMESEAMCDEPRVAGGPGVLSESAR